MLNDVTFANSFDPTPYQQFDENGSRVYENMMSGDWTWDQADLLGENPENLGAMFVPIILGSDKTTVSVATGQNEYWPIYGSLGNLHNSA